MTWLAGRGEEYAFAFLKTLSSSAQPSTEPSQGSASVAGAKEVAFFPANDGRLISNAGNHPLPKRGLDVRSGSRMLAAGTHRHRRRRLLSQGFGRGDEAARRSPPWCSNTTRHGEAEIARHVAELSAMAGSSAPPSFIAMVDFLPGDNIVLSSPPPRMRRRLRGRRIPDGLPQDPGAVLERKQSGRNGRRWSTPNRLTMPRPNAGPSGARRLSSPQQTGAFVAKSAAPNVRILRSKGTYDDPRPCALRG